jgi:hypothetical protein
VKINMTIPFPLTLISIPHPPFSVSHSHLLFFFCLSSFRPVSFLCPAYSFSILFLCLIKQPFSSSFPFSLPCLQLSLKLSSSFSSSASPFSFPLSFCLPIHLSFILHPFNFILLSLYIRSRPPLNLNFLFHPSISHNLFLYSIF